MAAQQVDRRIVDLKRILWLVPPFWLAALGLFGGRLLAGRFSLGAPPPSPIASYAQLAAPEGTRSQPDSAAATSASGTPLPQPSATAPSTPVQVLIATPNGVVPEPPSLPSTNTDEAAPWDGVQVHVIDVGEGNASLVLAPGGEAVLIDGGPAGSGVVQFLQSAGVRRLDLVIATHPHSDHIGGLIEVLQAIPLSTVVTNGQEHTTLTYEHFLDAILNSNAEYVEVHRGDTLALGGLVFEVLNPNVRQSTDFNENSMVLRLTAGPTTFLFMGDAGRETENDMIRAGLDLTADILMVGHHGSESASSISFLEAVRPEVAIYSAGLGNSYGHPAPETLASLESVHATVYGTDTSGTIIIECNRDGYVISFARGALGGTP